jgi:hypothetical protein
MNANERAIAFANARNTSDHIVCLNIARVAVLINTKGEEGENDRYKLVKALMPIVETNGSFMMPNMSTTSLYCGCEMNSVMIRR